MRGFNPNRQCNEDRKKGNDFKMADITHALKRINIVAASL
jgi:hypothetical protein